MSDEITLNGFWSISYNFIKKWMDIWICHFVKTTIASTTIQPAEYELRTTGRNFC